MPGDNPTTGRLCPNMVGFTCYNPACRDTCARDPRLDPVSEMEAVSNMAWERAQVVTNGRQPRFGFRPHG